MGDNYQHGLVLKDKHMNPLTLTEHVTENVVLHSRQRQMFVD